MRICCAISGFSSMFSLTMRTAPLTPRTTLSSIGPSCLQGPHHGAQKSTMTGWSNEASTTSAMKFAVVTSLTAAAAPAPASPPPIKGSSAIGYSPGNPCQNMAACRRDDKRRGRVCGRSRRRHSKALRSVEIDDARRVPAGCDKAQQIGGRDRRRTVVFERVIIERIMIERRAVEHHGDAAVAIIDQGEGLDAAGPDPEHLVERFGVTER